MSAPGRPWVSHAVASAWLLMLLPFVMAGLWTPLARATSQHAGTAIVPLIFASTLVGVVSLIDRKSVV